MQDNALLKRETKICKGCGLERPLSFFRRTGKNLRNEVMRKPYKMSVCKECEQIARDELKRNDPDFQFKAKAKDTIYNHAQKQGMNSKQFCAIYNLSIGYIATLFKREWKLHEMGFCCLNCAQPFRDMLADFSLDIIDRNRPPTRSNLRVICMTCNRAKALKDPTENDFDCQEFGKSSQGIQVTLERKIALDSQLTMRI